MRGDLLVYLWIFLSIGVFGVQTVEEVRKVEGDSVTLHSSVHKYQRIIWLFGPQKRSIAQCWGDISVTPQCEISQGLLHRLKIDSQTGSLTIINITNEDAGRYNLQIFNNLTVKEFNLIIYAPLPVPMIVKDSERSSCSQCVLKCSVMNVTEATLSWYKDKSLISSSRGSDLNNSFSLPLEVNYQDSNIYSCVLNNSISNKTKHLNISELCPACSESGYIVLGVVLELVLVLVLMLGGAAALIYWKKNMRKAKNTKKELFRSMRETEEQSSGDSTPDEGISLQIDEEPSPEYMTLVSQ